ncbi:uncharacterized protein Z518_02134 [Rhinocladiella mackenziei CBS 650.93]|uniref:RING-type E3 ubiquitin transferase n=1 Tax=Rhinocladiella mackenziei CBS 650.93 TaxID=1442369 RepID=A0A0D2IW53_9EURO|nr:uncharacterized protein Z518_02134 [Rhinocladiella mackenziei CBS 650.93]KIX07481.1 hypothetical protein Z518_02134 [Rhinocladiella mackenziei CBS 650.93]
MTDSRRVEGERVFCHQCNNEWDRRHGGLTCPRCEGDFTEILELGTTSSLEHDRQPSPAAPPPDPFSPLDSLHNHYPWQNDPDSNPRDNFTTFEFTSGSGRSGRISVSTRTFVLGGPGQNVTDAHDREFVDMFDHMLINVIRSQNRLMNPFPPLGFPRTPSPGFGNAAGGPFPARDFREMPAPLQPGNLQDLLSALFRSMQQEESGDRRTMGHPPHPFDFLNQIFNPENAQLGDAVYTQEAFDRIMTQLMEQNGGSATRPASDEAIRSLGTKKVDQEILGSEGKAECSICMDNVELGDEVTVLPCNHWFHGDCVKEWLKESDTCPHCRKPITSPEERQPPSLPRRRTSRRPSSVSSPRAYGPEGSRYNPARIPESPSELRERRQSYYGRRQYGDMEHSEPIQHSSSNRDPRRNGSRGSSGGSGGSGGSRNNSSGGGMTGWIRDHLPFS